MRISAQISLWGSVLFTLFAVVYAGVGFWSLPTIADPVERADAQGFAWFWMFLASIGIVFGTLSWLMAKGKLGSGAE